MPYLLDTCAILFIAENTADLSQATLKLIDAAPPGEVFVSAISPVFRSAEELPSSSIGGLGGMLC
jgi:PIN domain nuclease of toxin-antitoxin system